MASMTTKIPQKCGAGSDYRKNRYQGDGPAKCTWFPGTTEKNPHTTIPTKKNHKIMTNILDAIGNTPLVKA